jgi:aminoglycoside phosphotransferase (APT) family kinase protein
MSEPIIPLVHRPEDVTPEWLASVLGVAVDSFTLQPVGTGQMADSVRFSLEPSGTSVVLKFAAADDTSRATGAALRSYEIEVRWYQEIAPTVGIRTPHCHYAAVEPASGWFTLVLEDLAPAVQGDQLTGCTVDQAALALEELAKLHAPRWGDASLTTLEWFHRGDQAAAATAAIVQGLLPGFCERYADRLTTEELDLSRRVVAVLPDLLAQRAGKAITVTHGDYRLDNMLFGTDEGGPPLAVVDWQTATTGPGLADASYFLGAGLLPDDRVASEGDLLREYHRALVAGGVEGYPWGECWDDYRRYAFGGLLMAIGASMLVVRTDRGDDMFMAMASRHCAQVAALGAEEFLS